MLGELFKSLSVLSVELVPIHQRLVLIRKQLSSLAAMEKPPKSEVKALMEELRKIDRSVGRPTHHLCPRCPLIPSLTRSAFRWSSLQQTSGRKVPGAGRVVCADRTSVSRVLFRSPSDHRQAAADIPLLISILSGLLEECFEIAQDIRALHEDDVPIPLRPVSPSPFALLTRSPALTRLAPSFSDL